MRSAAHALKTGILLGRRRTMSEGPARRPELNTEFAQYIERLNQGLRDERAKLDRADAKASESERAKTEVKAELESIEKDPAVQELIGLQAELREADRKRGELEKA